MVIGIETPRKFFGEINEREKMNEELYNEELYNELREIAESLLAIEIELEKVICETADYKKFVTPLVTAIYVASSVADKAANDLKEAAGYVVA
jgi:hypothetical protein